MYLKLVALLHDQNFNADVGGVKFGFLTQHVVKLHGFQVYEIHDGQKRRFHMQINTVDKFNIINPNSCPNEYLPLKPI